MGKRGYLEKMGKNGNKYERTREKKELKLILYKVQKVRI